MIEVAITDDHPLTQKGVETILDAETDIQVISKAANGNKFMANIHNKRPDIAILDLSLPEESGLDLLKQTKAQFPDLPVLILSFHPAKRYALRCLKDGASGYLDKKSTSDELVKAIRYVIQRKRKYITDEVANLLADNIDFDQEGLPHKKLSDREFTVLCMIANGKNVKTIADELSLSSHTVQTYRSRIKEKMHLNTNVEMTRYTLEHDLV